MGRQIGDRPVGTSLPSDGVDYDNATRVRQVDEDLSCLLAELKSFRVRRQRNLADLGSPCAVDERERTAAISNVDLIRRVIDTDVIGVLAELDASCSSVIFTVKQHHRSVARIGDI